MIAFVLAVTVAASQAAGQGPPTIDPGMTRAQVVAKLGEPMSTRTYDGHTYLLYKNGCERSCGMSDLVVLDSDKVVDAVFRSSARHYSGTSSSPRMLSMADLHQTGDKAITVAEAEKADTPEKPAKAAKHTKIAKVEPPKLEGVEAAPKTEKVAKVVKPVKPAKVEKAEKAVNVENGETAPSKPAVEKPAPAPVPAAAPAPAAPPKLPEVIRPAPTPKKDTAKKSGAVIKPEPNQKPRS
jgi:SmpA/OmlA family protein